ncbi:hypothetical protein GQ457_15G028950 [Hibiscus cannabinus]
MTTNYWQFGELSEPNQRVHEVNNVSWEKKFGQFTDMIVSLIADKKQSFKPCGICTLTDHPTDGCPHLQDETVNAIGSFPGPPQMPYDPYGDTYNSGWQDHPNFSYAQNPWMYPTYQPYQPEKTSLELMMENLITSQGKLQDQLVQYQNRFDSRMQEVEKQVSLLAQTMSRIDSQIQGKLPSQTEPNPKENVSAITLRSGTVIEPSLQTQKEKKSNAGSQGDDTNEEGVPTVEHEPSPYAEPPPFPVRFIEEDKRAEEKENLNFFRKGEVHIPLLEVIQEMPRYAHFLKELCADTIKFSEQAKVNLGEHISMVLTRWFPPKIKDQDMVTITRKIHKISLKEVLSWSKVQCL